MGHVYDWVEILNETIDLGESAYTTDWFTIQPAAHFGFLVRYSKGGETGITLSQFDLADTDGTACRLVDETGGDVNLALAKTGSDDFVVWPAVSMGEVTAGRYAHVPLLGRRARHRITVQGTPNSAGTLVVKVAWRPFA